MAKNILIFSDGTGQKGGKNFNTNVYKLFNMVEDRTQRQIAFYDPGCGTDMRMITGNVFGRGFSKNILDCYHFIFENYEAGDDIFLFGFSRGAATVRSLSGFMHLFGILPKCREDLVKEAFKIYQVQDKDKRTEMANDFIARNHTMWAKVKFLGVWDTVAALGFPIQWVSYIVDRFSKHRFHSFDLSQCVEYARHALAIDEERKTFLPTLWDKLPDDPKGERMKQVWFSGVHTDVGGGYKESELSNIALCWMVQEATAKGLLLYTDGGPYEMFNKATSDANGTMHNEQTGFPGKLFRRMQRSWNVQTHGKPCIHESVKQRLKNNSNSDEPAYKPWILSTEDYTIEPWNKN
jgi:uncharacterized protein (DUF2235 family)